MKVELFFSNSQGEHYLLIDKHGTIYKGKEAATMAKQFITAEIDKAVGLGRNITIEVGKA